MLYWKGWGATNYWNENCYIPYRGLLVMKKQVKLLMELGISLEDAVDFVNIVAYFNMGVQFNVTSSPYHLHHISSIFLT